MNILQISVFLENRAGQLAEITRLLAQEGVDIRALSIAETSDYGLARMIVSNANQASSVLLHHGDILSMTPVYAVEVPDAPGGLAGLLGIAYEALQRRKGDLHLLFCRGNIATADDEGGMLERPNFAGSFQTLNRPVR